MKNKTLQPPAGCWRLGSHWWTFVSRLRKKSLVQDSVCKYKENQNPTKVTLVPSLPLDLPVLRAKLLLHSWQNESGVLYLHWMQNWLFNNFMFWENCVLKKHISIFGYFSQLKSNHLLVFYIFQIIPSVFNWIYVPLSSHWFQSFLLNFNWAHPSVNVFASTLVKGMLLCYCCLVIQ